MISDGQSVPVPPLMLEPPRWLRWIRFHLTEASYEAAREYFPVPGGKGAAYFNYRLEHVRQVERQALELLREVGGDAEVVLAAVWLHDFFQPGFHEEKHGPRAAIWAAGKLKPLGFPAEKIDAVCLAVSRHSEPPGTLPVDAHEARIFWDAHNLSYLGPFAAITDLINYLAADRLRKICSGAQLLTVEAIFRAGLDPSGGKGLQPYQFYFEASRTWAAERLRVQREFYECCRRQLGLDSRPDSA